jgi:hypothetical protein
MCKSVGTGDNDATVAAPLPPFFCDKRFVIFPTTEEELRRLGDSEADSQGNWGGGFLDQIRRKRFFFAKKTLARRESL